MDTDPSRQQQRENRIKLLIVLTDLAAMVWLAWLMLPEHQRSAATMRAASHVRRASQKAALRMGCNGMALELAAGQHAGRLWYETARLTMTAVHDRATQLYNSQRPC